MQLVHSGIAVVPGAVGLDEIACLAASYDRFVAAAPREDRRIGSTTVRVHGLLNGGPEFSALLLVPPLLAAARILIGEPFTLSSFLARSVLPHARAQPLHVDLRRDDEGWPMLGFILMIDGSRAKTAPPVSCLVPISRTADSQDPMGGTTSSRSKSLRATKLAR